MGVLYGIAGVRQAFSLVLIGSGLLPPACAGVAMTGMALAMTGGGSQ